MAVNAGVDSNFQPGSSQGSKETSLVELGSKPDWSAPAGPAGPIAWRLPHTQEELAHSAGIDPLSRRDRARQENPTIAFIARIAEVLDTHPKALFEQRQVPTF
jgi:hypothetical protein